MNRPENVAAPNVTTNLPRLLATRARERPDLVIGTVDDQITLQDALEHASGGAQWLADAGIGPGSQAAIVATTSTDYLVAWIACLLARVPVALVNPTYPPGLLATLIDDLGADIVFTDLDPSFAGPRPSVDLRVRSTWTPSSPYDRPGMTAEPAAIASLMHTSGTTGPPKFCAQSHGYFLRLGQALAHALGLTPADRMLAPLPLFHINPMGYGIIGALSAGADALTVRRFSAGAFWPTVIDHRITALALHAPPLEILKRTTTAADAAGHGVRTMFYADAEFMSRFVIKRAVSGYGSTEAAGVSHLHPWSLGEDVPADAGRYGGAARPDIEARVDAGGQILVRAAAQNTLFAGYFTHGVLDPSVDDDGWFATGDLGRLDDHGGLVFLERAAESIRVKGEFVPIPYVEEQLGGIEELTDLALWKRPGELVDDDIVLYVVADAVPVERIRQVAARLPAFMRPHYVARVRSIPRDRAAGKIQRRLLHDQEVLAWTELD